jgi:hypothetical protein
MRSGLRRPRRQFIDRIANDIGATSAILRDRLEGYNSGWFDTRAGDRFWFAYDKPVPIGAPRSASHCVEYSHTRAALGDRQAHWTRTGGL